MADAQRLFNSSIGKKQFGQAGVSGRSSSKHLAGGINAVNLEDRACNIETDCRDLCHMAPLIVAALTAPTSVAVTCRSTVDSIETITSSSFVACSTGSQSEHSEAYYKSKLSHKRTHRTTQHLRRLPTR
jgi:hypothetical protein